MFSKPSYLINNLFKGLSILTYAHLYVVFVCVPHGERNHIKNMHHSNHMQGIHPMLTFWVVCLVKVNYMRS